RLKSNVALSLPAGATIIAAEWSPETKLPGYDAPEPNEFDCYQDFAHSHWRNSLIWGIDIENVTISGPGEIVGRGLNRGGRPAARPLVAPPIVPRRFGLPDPQKELRPGVGNKAVALKNCRNVVIRDLTLRQGGHMAILATGTDQLVCDHLRIDTNKD